MILLCVVENKISWEVKYIFLIYVSCGITEYIALGG